MLKFNWKLEQILGSRNHGASQILIDFASG
jgi:hypothetical protein